MAQAELPCWDGWRRRGMDRGWMDGEIDENNDKGKRRREKIRKMSWLKSL